MLAFKKYFININHIFNKINNNRNENIIWYSTICIIVFNHLLGLYSFGATFWYDSIHYFDISYFLFEGPSISSLYEGGKLYFNEHFCYGISIVWGLLHALFKTNTWIFFALLQHAFAAVSLVYLLSSLRKYINPLIIMAASFVLTLHPFYQSFHNAVMTESFSSSLLLIILGAALKAVSGQGNFIRNLAVIVASTCVAIQFRSYMFLFSISFLILILFFHRKKWVAVILSTIVIISGLFIFPTARYALTKKFFMPNVDILMVCDALWTTPKPSGAVIDLIKSLDMPQELDKDHILKAGMSYEDAIKWALYLEKKGLSNDEIRKIIKSAAVKIRLDNMETILNQIDFSLFSQGITRFVLFHNNDEIFAVNMNHKQLRTHNFNHYVWLSWLSGIDYKVYLMQFMLMYKTTTIRGYSAEAIREMDASLAPFVKSTDIRIKDPLRMARMGTDIWVFGFLAGLVIMLLCIKEKKIILFPASVLAVNYIVCLAVNVGSIRYCYMLFPLYIFFTISSIGLFFLNMIHKLDEFNK